MKPKNNLNKIILIFVFAAFSCSNNDDQIEEDSLVLQPSNRCLLTESIANEDQTVIKYYYNDQAKIVKEETSGSTGVVYRELIYSYPDSNTIKVDFYVIQSGVSLLNDFKSYIATLNSNGFVANKLTTYEGSQVLSETGDLENTTRTISTDYIYSAQGYLVESNAVYITIGDETGTEYQKVVRKKIYTVSDGNITQREDIFIDNDGVESNNGFRINTFSNLTNNIYTSSPLYGKPSNNLYDTSTFINSLGDITTYWEYTYETDEMGNVTHYEVDTPSNANDDGFSYDYLWNCF